MGSYVVATNSPDRIKRFVRTFNGLGSVSFGDKASVSIKEAGEFTGNRSTEACKSIADIMRNAAATGKAPSWYSSVVVQNYVGDTIYPRPEDAVAPAVQDNPPTTAQAFDGSWRRVPVEKFVQTFRGWKLTYAFIDAQGAPRAGDVERATRTELVKILFDSVFPVFRELVLTFPQVEAPAPVAAIVEKAPTAAELAAVPMLDEAAYNSMPGAKFSYKYKTDLLFRASADKLWAHQEKIKAAFARKQKAEDETAAIAKLKREVEGNPNVQW